MMQRIAGLVKDSLPKFNDNLLVDLRKREVNGLIDFIAERYRECAMVADPNLELINYEVLSPVARLNYELSSGIKKNIINIRDDECVLVSYNFRYHDKRFEVALYVPYLYENSTIVVNGINYECFLNMTEKLFSIRTTSNGITIRLFVHRYRVGGIRYIHSMMLLLVNILSETSLHVRSIIRKFQKPKKQNRPSSIIFYVSLPYQKY